MEKITSVVWAASLVLYSQLPHSPARFFRKRERRLGNRNLINSMTTASRIATLSAIGLIFAQRLFPQGTTYEGPVGVTGIFNGNVTTGCSYDPLTHSAHRAIDDIVVPGSIGKYPLKMTRYYNSRAQYYALTAIGLSTGWAHEYSWLLWTAGHKVVSPHGNVSDDYCGTLVGVSEGWEGTHDSGSGTWRLADGGKVVFSGGRVTDIYDPHGLRTRIAYDATGQRVKVTEPGGRCLWFVYGNQEPYDGTKLLTLVQAFDVDGSPGSPSPPTGHIIDSVSYSYTSVFAGGYTNGQPINKMMLTGVTYSDGTSAAYTYRTDNVTETLTTLKWYPLLERCDDVRYNGPMHTIFYDYQNAGPHGAIIDEKNPGIGAVSSMTPGVPTGGPGSIDTFTETRGDGPGRSFTYTHIHNCQGDECGPCDNYGTNGPDQQMLTDYTDFKGINTHIGYDSNWYINSVQDANGHTTNYTRGSPPPTDIGQITKITHPDGKHIDYTYQLEPGAIGGHYIATVTDERGTSTLDPAHTTTYTRDPTTHLVTRIDYPWDANTPASYEEFTYNGFGQVLTHHLRNGAWESFVYDSRGLLADKYNAKFDAGGGAAPGGTDPHTHYDYYTVADGKLGWIDRVKKVTMPANYCGNNCGIQATETYEYDRAFDVNGITDPNGPPVAGRGLVTRITHTDNSSQTFKYDAYGNKRWEYNELGQGTSYIYDDYRRVLYVTNPLGKTTSYTYVPTNGGGSPYLHTTNNPDTITTPTGIKTSNIYDQNFRKTSSSVAGSTTGFQYDYVGNLTLITDPRGYQTYNTYDTRNRKQTTTEAYPTSLGQTTTWHYDGASNIYQIDRPDGTQETKTYDSMNRVLSDTVPKTSSPLVNLTTWFTYNPSGTISKITDARGSGPGDSTYTTTRTYDASDRKIRMTYPGGSSQQWNYDDAGNMKNRTTVNNETQYFFYDNRNRNNGTWWSNYSNDIVDWRYFGHDATNRLTEAENGSGGWGSNVISDVQRSYDAAGHLAQEVQNLYGVYPVYVNYPTYDDDGRLTRMNVSSVSYDFTYSYDAMGRLWTIAPTGGSALFQYLYDAASNETERDNLYNGVNQIYPRDALNRITTWDVKKGTTVLAHEGYNYDSMNRITAVAYPTPQPSDSFGYYLDGELKTANLGNLGHNLTYNFDNKGNRTGVVDNNVTSTYSLPNAIDQYYPTAAGNSITNGPEHEIQTYNGVAYSYINDERLQSATSGSTIYSMVYDALGRCVIRTLQNPQGNPRPTPTPRPSPTPRQSPTPTPSPTPGGATTYYIYDGEKPILEYDATSGASVGVNLYGKGIDEILERVAGTSAYFLHQNHEGSVTLLIDATDANGTAIERYRYDAFGAPTFYGGNWIVRPGAATIYDNRFLFTGREYAATYRSIYTTPAFNFYEYRARAYNPTLGRFMSEDPKLFVRSIGLGKSPADWSFAAHPEEAEYNLFRYCGNDPIDFTDPMGLDSTQNADGSYSYILQHDLSPQSLRGSYVEVGFSRNNIDRSPVQCARTARVIAGTALRDGWHNAPSPENGAWRQGAAVSNKTPVGSLVAHGWENSVYPNKSANDKSYEGHPENINHAGIFLGLSKDGKSINVLDQYVGRDGQARLEVRTWPRADWSQVSSNRRNETAPSPPLLRAKEME